MLPITKKKNIVTKNINNTEMFFPISYKNSTNCLSDQDFYQQEQNQQSFSGFHTLHFIFSVFKLATLSLLLLQKSHLCSKMKKNIYCY